MEIIGYENQILKKQKLDKFDKLKELKELWNQTIYKVFHSKEKDINEYKTCYEYVCKELRNLCINEEEYKNKYIEFRLDCYSSLLYVLEGK